MIIQYFISFNIIISSIMVISSIHPVHSIIWLVLCFINTGALFIIMNIKFVGLILLIIYVGAIAILFVFVIMMLNLTWLDSEVTNTHILPISLLTVLILAINIFMITNYNTSSIVWTQFFEPLPFSSLQAIGKEFYKTFDTYLLTSSFILLVAMVGAIVLALPSKLISKKQNMFLQITRNNYKPYINDYSNINK